MDKEQEQLDVEYVHEITRKANVELCVFIAKVIAGLIALPLVIAVGFFIVWKQERQYVKCNFTGRKDSDTHQCQEGGQEAEEALALRVTDHAEE